MRIFKIKNDSNNVQVLGLADPKNNTLDNLTFNCVSRAKNWEEFKVYIQNPHLPAKNFFAFPSGVLVFDEIALDCCRTIFEMAGEILTLRVERRQPLYLLNVLECVNGLDNEKSVWDKYSDGSKGRLIKYRFHKDRILVVSSIFKIPETSRIEIFTYAGIRDMKDEFIGLYQSNQLTGLVFEEV